MEWPALRRTVVVREHATRWPRPPYDSAEERSRSWTPGSHAGIRQTRTGRFIADRHRPRRRSTAARTGNLRFRRLAAGRPGKNLEKVVPVPMNNTGADTLDHGGTTGLHG